MRSWCNRTGQRLTLGGEERWYHRTGAAYDLSGAAYDELPDDERAEFVRVLGAPDLGAEASSCGYRVACGPVQHAESTSPSLSLRGSKAGDPATIALKMVKATQEECQEEVARSEAALRAALSRGEDDADLERAHTTAQGRLRAARKHSASVQAQFRAGAGGSEPAQPPAVSSKFMESLAENLELDMTDARWSYTQMSAVGCPVGMQTEYVPAEDPASRLGSPTADPKAARSEDSNDPTCELHGFLFRIGRLWLGPNKKVALHDEQEVSNPHLIPITLT